MNIDFIKWMVGYAKGFECEEHEEHLFITIPSGLKRTLVFWMDFQEWHKVYYPLLLQKAIEGWNLSSPQYYIQQSDYICIHDDYNEPCGFKNMPISDEAKEQALKYVKEQETK